MKNKQNKIHFLETSFFLRIIITIFYCSFFAICLNLPYLSKFFGRNNSLNIYAFSEMISFETIKEFEKKYNVTVRIKNFESNEELFTKFKITGGEGYDLITPTDYTVKLLHQEGLLHQLDLSKLPVLNELDERLLNKPYDQHNRYSLPLAWSVYGIIFKKSIFRHEPADLGLDFLFKSPDSFASHVTMRYKISMLDDFVDTICFASLYLFNDINNWSDERLTKIKELLIEQKKWIEAYLYQDIRQFLFSEVFHVALTSSMNMKRILDATADFDFKIPREGSLMIIENFAIPAKSKNADLAHKFINFALSKEAASFNSSMYGYNPTNTKAYANIERRFLDNPNIFPDDKIFAKLHLTPNDFPIQKFEEVWLEVKSA